MTTHLILGTGAVGSALARDLHENGHDVRVVNRSGSAPALPKAIAVTAADLNDPEVAKRTIAGADVTYQVTAPAYTRWPEEFPALQESILDAAEAAGSRLVLADNLYAYGDPDGAAITEQTPERPHTRKGKVRKVMADAALQAHRDGRVEIAISRPSNYVGGGYALFDNLVVNKLRDGKAAMFLGDADQPHSFSYVPDVARAMAAIGTSDESWGRVWIAPVLETMTSRELAQRLWNEFGHDGDANVSAIKGLGARLIGLFNPMMRESIEMMYEFDRPFIADASAIAKTLGVAATPVAEAISAMTAQPK